MERGREKLIVLAPKGLRVELKSKEAQNMAVETTQKGVIKVKKKRDKEYLSHGVGIGSSIRRGRQNNASEKKGKKRSRRVRRCAKR